MPVRLTFRLNAFHQVHTPLAARHRPAPQLHAIVETFAILIAIAGATPWPRPCRSVACLSLHASVKTQQLMRPTGEASGPIRGEFVSRLVKPLLSGRFAIRRASAAAAQSLAPGFLAMRPFRVDSVAGKLVVSWQ
jgi:hypothetical protein